MVNCNQIPACMVRCNQNPVYMVRCNQIPAMRCVQSILCAAIDFSGVCIWRNIIQELAYSVSR